MNPDPASIDQSSVPAERINFACMICGAGYEEMPDKICVQCGTEAEAIGPIGDLSAPAPSGTPQEQDESNRCKASAEGGSCVLPKGHNRGRADIPQNHRADPASPPSDKPRRWEVCPKHGMAYLIPDESAEATEHFGTDCHEAPVEVQEIVSGEVTDDA